MKAPFAVLLLGLFAAGCMSMNPPPSPAALDFQPDWSERSLESRDGHDHADPMQHLNLTTPNFSVLGRDPLNSPFYGGPPGGTLCGDAGEVADGRRIAVVESRSKVGFALADVTDAAHPKWLGELVMENTHVYDVAVVPDGKHIVAVTSGLDNLPAQAPLVAAPAAAMTWETPCHPARPVPSSPAAAGTDPVPAPHQVLLVDITDPENPAIIDRQPLSSYGHSAFSTTIDGRTWVLVSMAHGPYPPGFPQEATSGWAFYELQESPLGARLHLLSTYFVRGDVVNSVGQRSHDGWIAKHPVTGQTLGYLVGGDRLTVVDLADATQPKAIGTWSDVVPGREGYSANFHSVIPLERLWGGRHYTVVGPEFGTHPTDNPSGIVWVLDTTDPAVPREVAGWTLPHEVEWSGEYMFSNHYYGIHNETMFISMYHGGVWAVDLSPVLSARGPVPFVSLPSIGVFMPVDASVNPAVKVRWAPTVEEVNVFSDGTLVSYDSFSGLWTFKFDASAPAPTPLPWPIVPPHPAA